MTDIDWSKAPEGTTHWEPENCLVNAGWMKVDGNGNWFFWSSLRKNWAEHMIAQGPTRMSCMIARPAAKESEKAIDAVMIDLNLSPECRYIAERVLSAGYRKQEAV